MVKQLVVLASLLVGTGSAGMAMYLQNNPLAFSKKERVNLNTYLYSARTLPPATAPAPDTPVAEPDAQIIELPPVVVTRAQPALRPRAVTPSVAPATIEGKELRPCSEFRELGPTHVDDGVPSGTQGVRELCAVPRERGTAAGPGTT